MWVVARLSLAGSFVFSASRKWGIKTMTTKIKSFAERYSPLICLALAVLLFLSGNPTGILFGFLIIITGIILYFVFRQAQNKRERIVFRNALVAEANAFIENVKKNKALPTIDSSLLLEKNEKAFLEEQTVFFEPRSIRKTGGSGIGFRIAKGVYVGGYSGQAESHQEWRLIDERMVTLTDNRVIFRGSKENKTIPLNKIISITNTLESIEISIDGKVKPVAFQVKNSYIWASAVHIARTAENPLQLGDMKIEIEFK